MVHAVACVQVFLRVRQRLSKSLMQKPERQRTMRSHDVGFMTIQNIVSVMYYDVFRTWRQQIRVIFPCKLCTGQRDPENVCAFATALTTNVIMSQDKCTTPCGRDGKQKLPVSIAATSLVFFVRVAVLCRFACDKV